MSTLSIPSPRPLRHRALAGVLAAHALALLALWGAQRHLQATPPPPALKVELLAAATTPPEPAAPLPAPAAQAAPQPQPWPIPPVPMPPPTSAAQPAVAALPVPAPLPAPDPPRAAPARTPEAVLPLPPAAAAPRTLPSSAVAYVLPPPIELPLASRRLGEHGTVWLRVRVGPDGLPREVSLHRSSGHARLDEQALWAMKRARFQPQTENGTPIEWIVVAPLQYEID